MTSEIQAASNKRNAQKSTGPKTAAGKEASKQNSLKHGLASAIIQGSTEDIEINILARAIVGENPTSLETLIYAREAAEAQFIIERAKSTRASFLKSYDIKWDSVVQTQDPPSGSMYWPKSIDEVIKDIVVLDRYERRARSRRKKALRKLKETM